MPNVFTSSAFQDPDFTKVVHNLLHLEHDAIAAYKQTIERLENSSYKAKVTEFMGDHQRHLSELTSLAKSLNVDVPDGGDFKTILTQGKVVLADITGGDASILKAMVSNENDTVTAYSEASQHNNIPQNAKDILTKAHQDETRHRSWFEQTARECEQQDKAA